MGGDLKLTITSFSLAGVASVALAGFKITSFSLAGVASVALAGFFYFLVID